MLNVGHLATLINEKAVSEAFEYFDINAGTKLTADNVAKIKEKFYQQIPFLPVDQITSINQVTDIYMVDNHAFDTSDLLYPLTQILSIMEDNFLSTPDYSILGRDKQPLMLPVCVKSHKPEKYYFVSFDYNLYNHD